MFKSEHVETYLQDHYPEIVANKRVLTLRCYVNPISHELASEVDPEIADVLFKKSGSEYIPRPISSSCKFTSNIKPHSLSFCRHPEYPGDRVFIPVVSISKLEAGKVTPESNNWALMFTVSFEPEDKQVHRDLFDLLHEKFFLSFGELQPSLFPEPDKYEGVLCRLCEAPNPEFIVKGSKPFIGYCEEHEPQKAEDEQVMRIRDKAKAAAVAKEMADQGNEPEKKGKDPLLAGADINRRAAQRQKGSKRVH